MNASSDTIDLSVTYRAILSVLWRAPNATPTIEWVLVVPRVDAAPPYAVPRTVCQRVLPS